MGQAARVNAARNAERATRVNWVGCAVCGLDFPTEAKPNSNVERFNVCQRCCMQDIAMLMRHSPGLVCMLPTVRILQGKPLVEVHESPGTAAAALCSSQEEVVARDN